MAAAVSACASKPAPLPSDESWAKTAAALSQPLDVRNFQVIRSDDGSRSVLLKLSRLPDGVQVRTESNPARIILDIKGPTGQETPEERFAGDDSLVTSLWIGRRQGNLQVVLQLEADDPPIYSVHPMADWIMVRLDTPDA